MKVVKNDEKEVLDSCTVTIVNDISGEKMVVKCERYSDGNMKMEEDISERIEKLTDEYQQNRLHSLCHKWLFQGIQKDPESKNPTYEVDGEIIIPKTDYKC